MINEAISYFPPPPEQPGGWSTCSLSLNYTWYYLIYPTLMTRAGSVAQHFVDPCYVGAPD